MESTEETVASIPQEAPKEVAGEIAPQKDKPSQSTKDAPPKRSKKEERQHKKEDRVLDQFLKSIEAVSTEDKISILCKKLSELIEENRRFQSATTQTNKRLTSVHKEKEQLQLEYNRTVLVKCKLENLCRELQKQNKCIKEESLLKIREEEERRKEMQGKFQNALTEITTLLQQNNEKNTKLRDDNINMSTKFKSVVEKYELREQQVDKMAKQMDLEHQLSEAKLAKASLEAQAERERLLTEIAQLKLELSQYHARLVENQGTEASLRTQLNVYTEKYDEFQNALVKSNQVFGGFKGEIEKMSKKITKLEKECAMWKNRWQTSQAALLEMATDKRLWEERAHTERQLLQMQRLCRSMQAERTLLLNTLKEHNIERPPLPVLPPAPPTPAPQPSQPNKVDAMAANCAQLKQSLAQLQNQLNVLTTKKEEENQAKADQQTSKSKKGKGKKSKVEKTQQDNITNAYSNEDKQNELDKDVDVKVEGNKAGEVQGLASDITNIENEYCDLNTDATDKTGSSKLKTDVTDEEVSGKVKSDVTDEAVSCKLKTDLTEEAVSSKLKIGVTDEEVSSKVKTDVTDEAISSNVNSNDSIVKPINVEDKSVFQVDALKVQFEKEQETTSIFTNGAEIINNEQPHLIQNENVDDNANTDKLSVVLSGNDSVKSIANDTGICVDNAIAQNPIANDI